MKVLTLISYQKRSKNQFETDNITKMVNYDFQASRVPTFLASQTDGDAAQYHGREVLVHVPRVV